MSGRLLVLGAGTMGGQIAQQAALHDIDVDLVDTDPAQLRRAAAENRRLLERRVAAGSLEAAAAERAIGRVSAGVDLGVAAGCQWAIEAIIEEVDAKRAAFAELDRRLPATAGIATNSSNIVVSRLAGETGRPDRCCNMHFFHPVLRMDLCEVVAGPETSQATLAEAQTWARRMGRHPVLVEREIDGFVVNRILGAAWRQAFALLFEGVASVRDIDLAVRLGLNWPMGPFELTDFTGVDTVLRVREDREGREHNPLDAATVDLLRRLVAAGRLGRKSGCGFYDYSGPEPVPLPVPE